MTVEQYISDPPWKNGFRQDNCNRSRLSRVQISDWSTCFVILFLRKSGHRLHDFFCMNFIWKFTNTLKWFLVSNICCKKIVFIQTNSDIDCNNNSDKDVYSQYEKKMTEMRVNSTDQHVAVSWECLYWNINMTGEKWI